MKFEFSAGGIVYKPIRQAKGKKNLQVLVAQHSQHHGWVFPKGLIGDSIKGENKESTAVREVEEETGVRAKIIKQITPVEYWYQFEGEKRKKKVYYYIMEFVSEDKNKKDMEMEKVEWLPIEEVERRLTYSSDKKAWNEAKKHIANSV